MAIEQYRPLLTSTTALRQDIRLIGSHIGATIVTILTDLCPDCQSTLKTALTKGLNKMDLDIMWVHRVSYNRCPSPTLDCLLRPYSTAAHPDPQLSLFLRDRRHPLPAHSPLSLSPDTRQLAIAVLVTLLEGLPLPD